MISLHQNDRTIIAKIRDEGIGIAEASKPRIFEKFYQEDSSRSGEGNGLGLAIVKRIIEICGGRISFASREGEGTSFTVILPK